MEIKKTLDHIPRLIFWRIDDALILLIPFSMGILFGSFILMGGSSVGVWFYRWTRKRYGETNLKALSYWIFGTGNSKIPSHIRRFRR